MACRFWLWVYYFWFRKERDIDMQQSLRPRESLSFYGPSRREARRAWRARFRIKPVMYDLQPKSATETPWVLELLPLGCKVRNAVLLARPHLTAREAQRLHMSDTTRDSVISESARLIPIKGSKKKSFFRLPKISILLHFGGEWRVFRRRLKSMISRCEN